MRYKIHVTPAPLSTRASNALACSPADLLPGPTDSDWEPINRAGAIATTATVSAALLPLPLHAGDRKSSSGIRRSQPSMASFLGARVLPFPFDAARRRDGRLPSYLNLRFETPLLPPRTLILALLSSAF